VTSGKPKRGVERAGKEVNIHIIFSFCADKRPTRDAAEIVAMKQALSGQQRECDEELRDPSDQSVVDIKPLDRETGCLSPHT
jgi:hypothetical protein